MQNKQGFSVVEIIITASIIILLAVVGISVKQGYDEKINNTKVLTDTTIINNALEAFSEENGILPMPGGNTNFYKIDTTYSHSYEADSTFGVYGNITEDTIAKKYLDNIPLDPRTNSYYAYGKTKNTNEFEIATVQIIKGTPTAKVFGSYTGEAGPYGLIREYNGYNFVYQDSEENLPYNPEELILIATDKNGNIYREGTTITVDAGDTLEIFFSDGSVSILGDDTSETILTLNKLNFPQENNLSTIIKLTLSAGTIWTQATHLDDTSEFEIYTSDSAAAVRGTIFGVFNRDNNTETIIIEGEIDLFKTEFSPSNQELIKDDEITASGEMLVSETSLIKSIIISREDIHSTFTSIFPVDSISYTVNGDTINIINKDDVTIPSFSKIEDDRTNVIDDANQEQASLGDSCYLEGEEVKDGDDISAYYSKIAPCMSTTRICDNGVLNGEISFKYAECLTESEECEFEFDGECLGDENIDGIPLYAYAPYDNCTDIIPNDTESPTDGPYVNDLFDNELFKLYINDGNGGTIFGESNYGLQSISTESNPWNREDMCRDDGFVLDIGGTDEFLKYFLPTITGDFAIEMSIWFPNGVPTPNSTRSLFQIGNYKVYLTDIGKIIIENGGITFGRTGDINDPNYIYDGKFHKIVAIKKGANYSLEIDGNQIGSDFIGPSTIWGELFIGSNSNKLESLGETIDYVKIYKN